MSPERRASGRRATDPDVQGLPYAEQAERTILGAILLDESAFFQTVSIKAEDFGTAGHQAIFNAMSDLAASSVPIDLITLNEHLAKNRLIDMVGGVAYLSSLTDGLPHRLNIEAYCKTVAEKSTRRKLIHNLQASVRTALNEGESLDKCVASAQETILRVAAERNDNRPLKVDEFSEEMFSRIRRMVVEKRDMVGLRTGVKRLDKLTTGFRPSEYYVIAGWTKDGKTSLALQAIAANMLDNIPTLFFSQEMTKEQVMLRMVPLLTQGQVPARLCRNPRLMNPVEWHDFEETQEVMDAWPLWIQDASTMEAGEIASTVRYMKHKHNIGLVVVDYLQLIKASGNSRAEIVAAASAALRETAKICKLPVVALSQLSRPEVKAKRRPMLFDCKESGSIEQDAHALIFVFRPEGNTTGSFTGEDEIIVAAQREGPTGSIEAKFNQQTLIWGSRDDESYEYFFRNEKLFAAQSV